MPGQDLSDVILYVPRQHLRCIPGVFYLHCIDTTPKEETVPSVFEWMRNFID